MPGFERMEPPEVDRRERFSRLRAMLEEILPRNAFWRERLGAAPIPRDAREFGRLPLTSNHDLSADMRRHPPYGRNLTYPLDRYTKCHQTSGTIGQPLFVFDDARSWTWWCDCWDAVLDACGVESRDRAFFAFSFAPFIGFWSAYDAVSRRGLLTVPGGGSSTSRRLRLLSETGCTVLFSTPSYALRLAEAAESEGLDLASSPVRCAILAGEPGASLPAVRERIARAWNAEVYDHAGSSETGAYGVPCPDGRGMFVNEREFIAEVLAVDGDSPVADGETGELVLTNLGRWSWPVVRYRTGDLVRPRRLERGLLLEGGVLGRIDQMMLIRGVNVHPSAIEEAVRREAGHAEFRVTVTRNGSMDEADVEVEASDQACQAIGAEIRRSFGVRIEVRGVAPESLPRWEAKARRFRDRRR